MTKARGGRSGRGGRGRRGEEQSEARQPLGRPPEERDRPDEPDDSVGAGPETSRMGKGDSAAVAGSDAQQPEIAQGPGEGLEPGEKVQRGPWRAPLEFDAPSGDAVPRDAAGEPDAVREQRKEGGP